MFSQWTGRFWSLEYLQHPEVSSSAQEVISTNQEYQNTAIMPSLFPWSRVWFPCGTFGKIGSTGNLEGGKHMRKGKGCFQSFPSGLPHQIAQTHETWCKNHLSAYLCPGEAPRNLQRGQGGTEQPTDVECHGFERIARSQKNILSKRQKPLQALQGKQKASFNLAASELHTHSISYSTKALSWPRGLENDQITESKWVFPVTYSFHLVYS